MRSEGWSAGPPSAGDSASITEVVSRLALRRQQQEIERHPQEIDEPRSELAWRKRPKRELEEGAARKLALGINLNRFDAAAFFRISTRTLQRWEDYGRITRCPGYGTSVIYAARDIFGLASASSRKGA